MKFAVTKILSDMIKLNILFKVGIDIFLYQGGYAGIVGDSGKIIWRIFGNNIREETQHFCLAFKSIEECRIFGRYNFIKCF